MEKEGKIFVTGANGFIGAKLVQLLLSEGFSVRGLYHSTKPKALHSFKETDPLSKRLEYVQGDVTDVDSLRKNMAGCRYVFHLAGYAKNWARDFSIYSKVNIFGMRNIFQVAKELNVERVVWTSTIVTFGPTLEGEIADETRERISECFTEYERSKVLAEKEALRWAADGFPVVIVNPTRVFGPGPLNDGNAVTSLIDDYISGRPFIFYNYGINVGNYVFVNDVARGLYLAMQRGRIGERYILGSENITLQRLIQYFQEISGKNRRMIPVFRQGALFFSSLFALWAKLFGGMPRISPDWVRTFSVDWAYHSQKAERELGYRPIAIREAVRLTCEWLLEQKKTAQEKAAQIATNPIPEKRHSAPERFALLPHFRLKKKL